MAPNMRALKLLVIVLSVLLLAGIGALTTAIVWRINHAASPPAVKPKLSTVQRITLPEGAKVVGTSVNAGRLIVRVDMPNGGARLFVFDLATGDQITTIELAPALP